MLDGGGRGPPFDKAMVVLGVPATVLGVGRMVPIIEVLDDVACGCAGQLGRPGGQEVT